MAGLDARRNVRHRLQPAGALAVHGAERHGVGDACPYLRHAARERAGAGLEHIAYTDLFCWTTSEVTDAFTRETCTGGVKPSVEVNLKPSLHPTTLTYRLFSSSFINVVRFALFRLSLSRRRLLLKHAICAYMLYDAAILSLVMLI